MTAPDPRFAAPRCLFWGIGAQKAGTTWLHDYLSSHPDVRVPRVFKEQQYWNHVRAPHDAHILPRGRAARLAEEVRTHLLPRLKRDGATGEWAARQRAVARPRADHRDHATALFAHWQGEAAVGEITPGYARLGPGTFAEMAALSPRARFFFVMRDPVSRALSAARMAAKLTGGGPGDAIARALAGEDTTLLEFSDYARTLHALEAAGVMGRTAVFFYETLFRQPQIDRLCAHLGVSPHPADTDRVVFSFAREAAPDDAPALEAELRRRLAPVYTAVRARFGDDVPEAWRG